MIAITADQVLKACKFCGSDALPALKRERTMWTAIDVLSTSLLSDEDKLLVVLKGGVLPETVLRGFASNFAPGAGLPAWDAAAQDAIIASGRDGPGWKERWKAVRRLQVSLLTEILTDLYQGGQGKPS